MSAAYFIVLDNPNPGFDVFVNGKAIVRDAERLSKIANSIGIPAPEDYFAMDENAEALAAEFGIGEDVPMPPDQWFEADEGLDWVRKLRGYLESTPTSVKDVKAVLADLAEFEQVFSQAKSIGAKWHFSIDF